MKVFFYKYKNKRLINKADNHLRKARLIVGELYGRIDWMDNELIDTVTKIDDAHSAVIEVLMSIEVVSEV